MENRVRLRFAPSPTGPLHIGGARSALFNYLYAKKMQGDFILRIEDTDLERSSRKSEEDIKKALIWLGIDWTEGIDKGGLYGPYRQTERIEIYNKYIQELISKGFAYRCYCSEAEIAAERNLLEEKREMPIYQGKCRNLTNEQEQLLLAEGRKPVIRFRTPIGQKILIDDAVRGIVTFESDGVGDFIIVKSDGIPVYNFAVVIDDITMKITHVVRGEEHLANTPRQILIYEALAAPKPIFAHISLILGTDRSKMSKRHGSTSVVNYQNDGYLPEALINFLALLGWSPEDDQEFFSVDELITQFSLERVAKNPAVFDKDKLNYINAKYIKELSVEELTKLAIPYLVEAGFLTGAQALAEKAWLMKMIAAIQNRLVCVKDVVAEAGLFFEKAELDEEEAKAILAEQTVPLVLESLINKLEAVAVWPEPLEIKKMIKIITKELGLGGKQVFMPIRIALTGKMSGPEMHDFIYVIGIDEVKKRLNI